MVVDLDNREIVCLDYVTSPDEDTHARPLAVASIDDPAAILDVADWARDFDPVSRHHLDPPQEADMFLDGDTYARRLDERFQFHPSVGGPPVVPFNPYDTYAERARAALNGCADIETIRSAAHTHPARNWWTAGETLLDGQWLRPKDFPESPHTPWRFPAQRYLRASSAPFDADTLLQPMTDEDWGTPLTQCTHIGVRSKKRCKRSVHSDDRHRYE